MSTSTILRSMHKLVTPDDLDRMTAVASADDIVLEDLVLDVPALLVSDCDPSFVAYKVDVPFVVGRAQKLALT